jgi:hypothetical protein
MDDRVVQSRPIWMVARPLAIASATIALVATGSALAYRAYLAHASTRLAATGAREEALFALTIDPFWKVELGIARLLGNAGTLGMINFLGTAIWAALFVSSILIARRVRALQPETSFGEPRGRPTRG